MKTLLPKLFRYRLAQAGVLLAVIAAVAASVGWSGGSAARNKLEGAWIYTVDNGAHGLVTYSPMDPSGQSATFHNQILVPPAVLASMGLDAVSDEVAEEFVTGNGTSVYHGMWYGLAAGKISLIFVDDSVVTRDTPTHGIIQHTVTAYLASADADNDGFPDPASTPVGTLKYTSVTQRLSR